VLDSVAVHDSQERHAVPYPQRKLESFAASVPGIW
jgi:hypothetical protein